MHVSSTRLLQFGTLVALLGFVLAVVTSQVAMMPSSNASPGLIRILSLIAAFVTAAGLVLGLVGFFKKE